jgi:hypothetical protein
MNTRQAKKVLGGKTRPSIDTIQRAMVKKGLDGLDVIKFGIKHDHYIISHTATLNRVLNHKALQKWLTS